MPDLGPGGATLLIVGLLSFLGLFFLFVADGPREFFLSFRRGFRAIRLRWKIYLLDILGFFSLVAFTLGLMATIIALGAVIWYLVRGPTSRLGDYRLYLPVIWTVFWLFSFFLAYRVGERLKREPA